MTDINLEQLRIQEPNPGGKMPVVVRKHHESDAQFIIDGWLKTYRNARAVSKIPSQIFFYWHGRLIEGLWDDSTAAWLVACNPEHPGHVYGFLVGQQAATLSGDVSLVHYCYIARPYRGFGLASRLLATFNQGREMTHLVTTHKTDAGSAWIKALDIEPVYNPYLFLGRAPVPQPQLVGYGGKKARKKRDPVVTARRNAAVGGYRFDKGQGET